MNVFPISLQDPQSFQPKLCVPAMIVQDYRIIKGMSMTIIVLIIMYNTIDNYVYCIDNYVQSIDNNKIRDKIR